MAELATEKKRLTYKTGCISAVIIVVGLGVIVSFLPNNSSGSNNASKSGTPPIAEIKVTARELAKAFETNEVAAQAKYGDKPLLVTGVIHSITLDFADDPVLQLVSTNQFLPASAALGSEGKAAAATLKKGQTITLHCANVTEIIGAPRLEDCRL